PSLGGERRIQTADRGPHTVDEQHVAVIGPLRCAAVRADVNPGRRGIAKLGQPCERSFLDVAFGEAPTHCAASAIFSASRTRISPDISLGSRRLRVAARARTSFLLATIWS